MTAVAWLSLASVFASCAFSQHAGGAGGERPAHSLRPPLHGGSRRFAGFPFLWGGYGDLYSLPEPVAPAPPPAASLVILQQVSREIVRPEIHEYSREPAGRDPADEQPTFSIVLADGTPRNAVAVAVQGDALVYVDPDGRQQRVALNDIDRDATRRLNRSKGLDLRLPPPRQ